MRVTALALLALVLVAGVSASQDGISGEQPPWSAPQLGSHPGVGIQRLIVIVPCPGAC